MPNRRSEQRVLLFPATRRDGDVVAELLAQNGIWCRVCGSVRDIVTELATDAGAVLLTDVAFNDRDFYSFLAMLKQQPSWSDIPVVLLSSTGSESLRTKRMARLMSNVTLLDRPATGRTLLSTVLAALRSRARQYELRDQLAALEQAKEALHAADRRKDEFLAMLAHELRNPLAPIRNASELLPRLLTDADPRVSTAIAIVQRQVAQLTRLVDDLLDISRITQGRIELQRSPQDLAELVLHALESVEPAMREKRHNVVHSGCDEPVPVDGDGARLLQIISNLLLNAAKYTDAGGEIHVDLRRENSTAVISVRDNGVGIPADLLPTVFEPFVQVEQSLSRSEGGLGIGLTIVRQIAEMHGGKVSATSAGPGKGSTFEIRLPLAVLTVPSQTKGQSAA